MLEIVRYDLLSKFCKKNKTKYLLTAHHQDDQIETFLLDFQEEAGSKGYHQ